MTSSARREPLPRFVGLCPEHVSLFYMPDPAPGDLCPECDLKLVVYKRTTLATARRAVNEAENKALLPALDDLT
jgi:hypothetical protein